MFLNSYVFHSQTLHQGISNHFFDLVVLIFILFKVLELFSDKLVQIIFPTSKSTSIMFGPGFFCTEIFKTLFYTERLHPDMQNTTKLMSCNNWTMSQTINYSPHRESPLPVGMPQMLELQFEKKNHYRIATITYY